MKVREIISENKQKIDASKPRNFVAKNAKMGGAGQHKDKKKAAKQGDVKHKSKEFAEGVAEGSLEEYGDTAKGQKMLTKVQKRAVDRVTSKKADTDPKYAKKNSDTANRAWDRMAETATAGSTSAGNVTVGAVYKNKKAKMQKPGTNALDMKGGNLLTGGSIKR